MGIPSDEPDLSVDLEQAESPDASQRLRRAYALILRVASRGDQDGSARQGANEPDIDTGRGDEDDG